MGQRYKGSVRKSRVPFFFKQVGGDSPDKGGDVLDGMHYKEFPEVEVASLSRSQQLTMPFD